MQDAWTREILDAAAAALRQSLPLVAGLLAVASALVGVEVVLRRRLPRALPWVAGAALAVATGLGLWRAWGLRWLCDDAFISFRYSLQLARGNGLVFNPGEWVEGYTNFLWTWLLGVGAWLGLPIPQTALVGDLASLPLLALLVAGTVWRATKGQPSAARGVPFAALATAGSLAVQTYATSGLETLPAAALVGLGVWMSTGRRPQLAALPMVAAALARPDHVLYAVALGVAFAVEGRFARHGPMERKGLRVFTTYVLLAAPLFLAYWGWRWATYGDFFPNTYYAKSGGGAYWSQGVVYATHFLATTGFWLALPVALVAFLVPVGSRHDLRLRVFALLSLLLMGGYVVRVGGDFMEFRFFVALVPIVAAALEVAVRAPGWPKVAPLRALALAAAAVAVTPVQLIGPFEKRWFLAQERSFYVLKGFAPELVDSNYQRVGKAVGRAFPPGGPQPRLAGGCVGMVGYYSSLPMVDVYGLVNRRIAHRDITVRDRPGHEKRGTREELLAEGAVLSVDPVWEGAWLPLTTVEIPGTRLYFARYDQPTADAVRRAGGSAVDPRGELARLLHVPLAEALEALPFLANYLALTPELLTPLRTRLGVVDDFEGPFPAPWALQGFSLRREAQAPPGLSGFGWLASDGVGEAVLPLDVEQVSTVSFVLLGQGKVGARLERLDGSAVAERAPASASRGRVATIGEVPPGRYRLVFFDQDPDPAHGLEVDLVRAWPSESDARLARLLAAGSSERPSLDDVRTALNDLDPTDQRLAALEALLAAHYTFDEPTLPPGATTEGNAFWPPVEGTVGAQQPVQGIVGARLLNGFANGDGATGQLRVPLPVGGQVEVNALVGGGRDCQHLYLGLRVKGVVVARACGREDEVLRPVTLRAEVPEGEPVELVAVDEATGGWGHLLVDDVLVWGSIRPAGP